MNTILQLQPQTHWSLRKLCRKVEQPHASFQRWKSRRQRGEELVRTPGPKPQGQLDLGELQPQVQALAHRRQRTLGAGGLYRQVCFQISRRRFAALVLEARRRLNQERAGQMLRVQWIAPGVVWSMDDTELFGRIIYLLLVMDVASRYKFKPMIGARVHGPMLAVRLWQLFLRHGPPLIFKRDNGSNLNHGDVNDLFELFGVIALNSPPYYPQYNGGMERAIREAKESIREYLLLGNLANLSLPQIGELTVAQSNHHPRRCLQWHTADATFGAGNARLAQYNLRRRKEIRDCINELQARIEAEPCPPRRLAGSGLATPVDAATARRLAIEIWLQREGLMTLARRQNVLPGFQHHLVH